jgi:hypothetical protein
MYGNKLKNLILFFIVFIAGCGGGASPPGSAADNSSAVSNPGATTIAKSDSEYLDFRSFWNQNISSEFSNSGIIIGYGYKDFKYTKLQSNIVAVDKLNQSVTLEITHNNHGVNNGDILYLSGIKKTLHGIPFENYNKQFKIDWKNLDVYRINVQGIPSQISQEIFYADITYKYKECDGIQSVNQKAIDLVSTLTDGISLYKNESEVNTKLNGCSPSISKFITNKFYKKSNCINCALDYKLVKQEIIGGLYSEPESDFKLPSESVKIGSSGLIGTLYNYANFTKLNFQGKTIVSYESFVEGCCTPAVIINSKTYDSSGILTVEVKDYFTKITSQIGAPYSLASTIATYNNLNRNEIFVEYITQKINIIPKNNLNKIIATGKGTLNGTPIGTQNWSFIPFDVKEFPDGTNIKITINLGFLKSSGSYDLFSSIPPKLTPDGRPIDSLSGAYDVPPGTITVLNYKIPMNGPKKYYLGVEGNWFSSVLDTNTYSYVIEVEN